MIEIDNRQDKILITDDVLKAIEKSIITALKYEGFDLPYEISVIITDNDNIKQINNEFRKLNKETDVLSFPLLHFSYTDGYIFDKNRILDSDLDLINPETNEILLGDIIISMEKAYSQAEEYGHSLIRETAFLTVHSVLHLLGYDHEIEADRLIMRNKEEEILENMQIFR